MGTSAGFTPAGAPPCDPQPMTHAAIAALRTAGLLRVDCHYIVSDWTEPNNLVGPNLVELHALSPGVLSMEAKVSTQYDDSAWVGVYDFDGGPVGVMRELRDNLGNTVRDFDGGTTLQEFPWGNVLFRDNFVEDTAIIAWESPGLASFRDNRVIGATVDLSGADAGDVIAENTITDTSTRLIITDPGAGALSLRRNVITQGFDLTINAPGAGAVVIVDSVMRGDGGDSTGSALADLAVTKTAGTTTIDTCQFATDLTSASPSWTIGGTGNTLLDNTDFVSSLVDSLDLAGSGDVTIQRCQWTNARLATLAAQAVPATFSETTVTSYKIRLAQTAGAGFTAVRSELTGFSAGALPDMDVLGTGLVSFQNTRVVNDLGTLSPQFLLDGSGSWQMNHCNVVNSVDTPSAPMSKSPASTGSLLIFGGSQLLDTFLHLTGAGDVNGSGACNLQAGGIQHNGAGLLTLSAYFANTTNVTMAAPSTRGLTLGAVQANSSTITQNGTGGAGVDSITDGELNGTVTLNNTAATAGAMTITRFGITESSTLTVADCVALNAVDGGRIENQSIVNLTPGGQLDQSRVAMGATLNAGHLFEQSILELNTTRTTTAGNLGRLLNKSFDDLLAV